MSGSGVVLPRTIVLITDCTDVAFAEMRGAILSNAGAGRAAIEPLVPVWPFSVVNAAFALRLLADAYPPGTVISVIMNSLVARTERIIGRTATKDLLFEGTNTGAFGWLLNDFGCAELYELHDPGFVPFGGKFVHAPAVGRAASGVALRELGTPFDVSAVHPTPLGDGMIVHVDNFGNAKFPYSGLAASPGDRFRVSIGSHSFEAVHWVRMMERAEGEWVLYPGSSWDLWELGQVRSNGLIGLGVGPGETVNLARL